MSRPVAFDEDQDTPEGSALRGTRAWRSHAPLIVVATCVAVAIVSLLVPATLAYDSWAWLTWGRQVGNVALDTARGPSWKPLPVLATALLAPFGSLAVPLWLIITRTIGLLTLVAAYRLSARFAGWIAGVIAALLLLVAPDGDPRYLRLVFEGHTAPLTAALLLWAVDRHLAGRHTFAFLLGVTIALDRPEAWPFLGLYALWLWKHDPALRRLVMVSIPVVPLLWFGGDWWGSGSPMHGADAARVVAESSSRTTDALARVVEVVPIPAWVLSAYAVVDARRRGERSLLVIAGLAVGWLAVVVGMTAVFGYAALSRFLLPGAALLCVLAGIGAVRAYQSIVRRGGRVAFVVILLLVGLPFVAVRASGIRSGFQEMRTRDRVISDLDDVVEQAGGRDRIVGCGRVAISDLGVSRVALAWKLDVPISATHRSLDGRHGVTFVVAADQARRRAEQKRGLVELASTREWVAYGAGCAPERE